MNPAWLHIHDRLLAAFGPQHWWPGDTPFEVMTGAVLTQNTAWGNVEKAIARLKAANALSGRALLDLEPATLADLIRPAGYFNVKTRRLKALCAYLEQEGALDDPVLLAQAAPLPELRRRLLAVNGVGEETADSILLYALDLQVFVVDAYTRRLFTRLGRLRGDERYSEIQAAFTAHLPPDRALYNEYHALIVHLGKEFCRPRPRCGACPLNAQCPVAG
ncbi:MAG: endonuclease [Betaproteobacteria bacterium]|nr:endonuclease [Betaproteobacteria bacterium]